MNGRPKTFREQDVLEKARRVFWAKGYASTSTEDLLEAMGIGRGSFYLAFKNGKRELFEKAMRQFHHESFNTLKQQLQDSDDPVERIREFFRGILKKGTDAHPLGCFIGNTLIEMASLDEDLKAEAATLLKELENLFYVTLQRLQKDGTLKTKTDAKLLARHLITLWNGLNVTRRMYANNAVMKPLIEMQLEILR
ncbi:TetR/AcrR family transcriptional regulator [Chryseolinea lacunae]|uniref:TetR/AcrR family transcriptional regulator n=1 Tax=Chryseolinea lacunae TaxID=2801331 RepID=A0ABS1KNI9_9BACT|nr:TetR/AcrR family transcriptional regulator [Chryseolinea lacunae]MBL0740822.1 TetR/AcrR family transcriptional regulator [Chryseolinea lacunae]